MRGKNKAMHAASLNMHSHVQSLHGRRKRETARAPRLRLRGLAF
ncbi:hypothetical protein X566_14130 [Afipia sp. P52-10]|nr:hypothetical protein X566_14130 [Afipia sp. P52-10]